MSNEFQVVSPVSFPGLYLCGLCLAKMGRTSFVLEFGLFPQLNPGGEISGTSRLFFIQLFYPDQGVTGLDLQSGHFVSGVGADAVLPSFAEEAVCLGRSVVVRGDPYFISIPV